MNFKKRCEDCKHLRIKNKIWTCEECFGQLCQDIDDCPEGVTVEEVEAIEKLTKENKVKLNARADKPKERKAREVKPDVTKEAIISEIAEMLPFAVIGCENVTITNKSKLVEFDFEGNHYKLDLIRQRKPKK